MNTNTLVDMLSIMRPAGSKAERRFIKHYLTPLGVKHDDVGNVYKRIGDLPILWSSHTDTVHGRSGMQSVTVLDNWAMLSDGETANCLGADDTVGVWIMTEMIKAKRPGLYVFHRAEEQGGRGSNHIRRNPKLLEGINCAIAFDRKGYGDVITHQGSRCCSDVFAEDLAKKLGGVYKPSDKGLFTDTANYTDHVAECTNLSVGYYDQHSKGECTDLTFAAELREKMCDLDFGSLPIIRKPGEHDAKDYMWSNHPYDIDNWHYQPDYYSKRGTNSTTTGWSKSSYTKYNMWADEKSMVELVEEYPEAVAEILMAYGLQEKDLIEELKSRGEIL
jgi:hypothetical protein